MKTKSGIVLTALLALTAPLVAHPVPFSYIDLHVGDRAVDLTIVAHVFDLGHDVGVDPPERLVDQAFVDARSRDLIALVADRVHVTANGRDLTCQPAPGVEVLPERQSLAFRFTCAANAGTGAIALRTVMFPYDPMHQTFLNVFEGPVLASQAILDRRHDTFEYFAGTRQGTFAVVKKFVAAGIHHILIGPDHLLFLVGLLLLGGTMRRLAMVVTSFTVAHSVTLSLAALNLFSPPPWIIEPAIALSIVYVGADNLLVKHGRDVRAWIAFAFGFVHGFGFASVLREMDLPRRALGWSLFSFNLGVEIGQLMVVVAVAGALAVLRARSETAWRKVATAGSIVVILAGTFWFVQRVFFFGGV